MRSKPSALRAFLLGAIVIASFAGCLVVSPLEDYPEPGGDSGSGSGGKNAQAGSSSPAAGEAGEPGGGQGAAVGAALELVEGGTALVLNADVPCVVPHDLRTLAGAAELGALGYVEAEDGTTNALGLPEPAHFAPLYGGGSAARFRDHAEELGLTAISCAIPNLSDDVDTMDDLRRIGLRAGPRTLAALGTVLQP